MLSHRRSSPLSVIARAHRVVSFPECGTRLRRASREKPLTVGRVTVAWRVHSTRRPLASVVDLGPTSCA
jgi:hypothetical protein